MIGSPCNSVVTKPEIRRVKGSSWYNQARQNAGIEAFGIETPQNKENYTTAKVFFSLRAQGGNSILTTTRINGFSREAIYTLGVKAASIWPRVTEKNSVAKIMKKW
jgi:hypothetical protein